MSLLRTLRELCPDKISCPAIRISSAGDLFVQGYVITDLTLLAELDLPSDETVVRIPAADAAVLLPDHGQARPFDDVAGPSR